MTRSAVSLLNSTLFLLQLLLWTNHADRSNAFVVTMPLLRVRHDLSGIIPSISSSTGIGIANNVVLAAKGKKPKKRKRPVVGGGGGFGVGATNTSKSPSPPREEENNKPKPKKLLATASHILIKDDNPQAEAMLRDIKAEVGDDPARFAHYASQYSECGSKMQGGNLGEFGMGQMAKEFEDVVFNEEVRKVHGPVKTQFGHHLIYISERTDPDNKMENYFNSLL